MHENLVIVESPAKAKTIEKFWERLYGNLVYGTHQAIWRKKILELTSKIISAQVYVFTPDKKKIVTELKKLAKEAQMVWLASDEDREGEAIAWHLKEVLKLKPENTKRIVFHEITKEAIQKAIENPRSIDENLGKCPTGPTGARSCGGFRNIAGIVEKSKTFTFCRTGAVGGSKFDC
jgi:DNA topoisomerase I